jgi:hypothetical protein
MCVTPLACKIGTMKDTVLEFSVERNNLEDLAKELLARTGFGSFIRNAYKTGAESDLRATHHVTGGPLLC